MKHETGIFQEDFTRKLPSKRY